MGGCEPPSEKALRADVGERGRLVGAEEAVEQAPGVRGWLGGREGSGDGWKDSRGVGYHLTPLGRPVRHFVSTSSQSARSSDTP